MRQSTLRLGLLYTAGFRFTFIALCCAYLLSTGGAQAQTIIDWTGGGTDDRYNNAFNWTGLNVPNTTLESARFNLVGSFDVTFGSGVTTTVSDLIVQAGGINFAANAVVPTFYNVDDDLILNGGVLILSDTGGNGDVRMDVASDTDVGGSSLLRINSGSRLETNNLFAGRNSNGDGTVIIDDATLDVLNSVILGSSGSTGTLTFKNGSSANDIVGTTTLVSGSIASSTGRLNVLSGSTLSTANIRVGSLSTSASAVQEATVTVDGNNSILTMTGASTLTIGDATNPNVTSDVIVSGGGEFNTGTGLTLIQNSGHLDIQSNGTFNANGDVTIDGGTLTRSIAGSLNLAASKKLTASNDAQVTLTGAYSLNEGTEFEFNSGADLFFSSIGVGFFGSDGTLVVDGVGSTVTTLAGSTSGIGIDSGTAAVTFRNEATGTLAEIRLSNTNDADPNTTGILNVESGAIVTMDDLSVTNVGGVGASGTVTVTGAGSTLTQNGASLLTLGHASTGAATINIENGGTFTTGTGTTTINATGTIDIQGGGTFNANGPVNIDGGTLLRGNVPFSGLFNLASGQTLTASNDGLVDFTDAHVINGDTTFEFNSGADFNISSQLSIGNVSGHGTLIVDGPGSSVTLGGDLTNRSKWYDADVTFRNGATGDLGVVDVGIASGVGPDPNTISTVLIESGATVTTDTLIVVGRNSTATLTVDGPGSALTQKPGAILSVGDSFSPTTGTGTLNVQNGGTLSGGTTITIIRSNGTINIGVVGDGMFIANASILLDAGVINLGEGGQLSAGTISPINGGQLNFTGGRLSVVSYEDNLTNDGGTLAPGSSAGTTNVTGSYTVNAGTLEIELFGNGGGSPVAGVDFDQLVADTVNLAGTLDLVIDPNYSPTLGDMFPIISTTSGVSGIFGSVNGAYLGGGLALDVTYGATDVIVEVIDTPLGDFDVDGVVDGKDLLAWQRGELLNPLSELDLTDWEANYGAVAPLSAASTTVPEPSTWFALLMGMMAMLFRRDVVVS